MFSTRCPNAIRQVNVRQFTSTSQQCLYARKLPKVFKDGKAGGDVRRAALPSRKPSNPLPIKATPTPPYPYGPARWYKQSNMGLYGGARLQFGNNVSEDTETKTRRTWHPNIKRKRLWSRALHSWIRIRVSTRVLRTIDKVGGLDEYLLGDKTTRIRELGISGWRLRCQLMATKSIQHRLNGQRRTLGLPEIDYNALVNELLPPPEIFEISSEGEQASEFEVELAETSDAAAHGSSVTDDVSAAAAAVAQDTSREQIFVERVAQAQQEHLRSQPESSR